MRNVCLALALVAFAGEGCSLFHKNADEFSPLPTEGEPVTNVVPKTVPKTVPKPQKLIVTPATTVVGKVMAVNETTPSTRFVVVGFPIGKMPALNTMVGIYRQGNKIAEVKLTGPQSDENIVAEIVNGEPVVGDEARTE